MQDTPWLATNSYDNTISSEPYYNIHTVLLRIHINELFSLHTSYITTSAAQGGGGSFKDWTL